MSRVRFELPAATRLRGRRDELATLERALTVGRLRRLALEGRPVTWLVTARRGLRWGMGIFPVVPPLVQARRDAFPAVRALTRLLRWNPLALDIADALVTTRATTADGLRAWLEAEGVER